MLHRQRAVPEAGAPTHGRTNGQILLVRMKLVWPRIRLVHRMLKPLSSRRWNYSMAAHLLNRAGFGGPPEDITKLQDLGLDGAVDYLVDFEKIPDPTPDPEWA